MEFLEELNLHKFMEEAKQLFIDHKDEIDLFDKKLDIAYQAYHSIHAEGMMKLYSVRDQGELVGYCAFFLYTNMHHKTFIHAKQDVLFIKKDKRGIGLSFLDYCESQLNAIGVHEVLHCVPASNDWGLILRRKGYHKLETTYTKELGHGGKQ